jgi:hypothetical protein
MSHHTIVIAYGGRVRIGKAPPDAPQFVVGSPDHRARVRRQAAALVREVRAMWPALRGSWTRKQWNAVARGRGRQMVKEVLGT